VLLANQPVQWNLDPTMFNVGNVLQQNEEGGTLFLGPAERADIIVDLTNFAGKTLILYNDAPTAFPALDPHYDYYTGAPDRTDMGGYVTIPAGVGPNIRTVMQIAVTGTGGTAPVNDYNPATLAALQTAFASTPTTPGAFAASQDPIIVGQRAYGTAGTSAYNLAFPYTYPNWGVSNIFSTTLSFMKTDGTLVSNYPMLPKAIHDEMGGTFDDYGRMSAKLGLEVKNSNAALSTFAMQTYSDPATEIVNPGQVQIWKITHNGVDTHPIHFHLFDVQLINRVGWDGFIRLPDANELGWKDTVRMAPLEDTIVALRPVTPRVPFALPNSVRPLNPTQPLGSTMGFGQIDPLTGAALEPLQTNVMANFGHEYVWHCHILSHEENDMMRAVVFNLNAQTELILRNTSNGQNAIWNLDGTTRIGAAFFPTLTDQNWQIVARGDFNADSKRDIVLRNASTGQNSVWYMDGAIRTGSAYFPLLVGASWNIVGTGDFNNNGKPDLVWRNTATGQNAVWYMDGVNRTGSAYLPSLVGASWNIVGTVDFNNNGKPDLVWRNSATGQNAVWYFDGVTRTGSAYFPPLVGPWNIVGTGDFNADVNRDILWRNSSTGANMVWFMDGTTQTGTGSITPALTDLNWKIVGQ
jgi:FtsP/CotA-like multicopper oxidase with cupredoxin domain